MQDGIAAGIGVPSLEKGACYELHVLGYVLGNT